eukprot:1091901_1
MSVFIPKTLPRTIDRRIATYIYWNFQTANIAKQTHLIWCASIQSIAISNCKHIVHLVCFDCNLDLQTRTICPFGWLRLHAQTANKLMSIVCFIRISNRKQTHIHLVCFDWNFQLQIQCLFGVLQLESQTANKLVTSNKMRQTKFMNTESNEQIGMHCTAQHKLENRRHNMKTKPQTEYRIWAMTQIGLHTN